MSAYLHGAGPFRQDPPWTDDNRVEAEALLELGGKVGILGLAPSKHKNLIFFARTDPAQHSMMFSVI